MNIHDDLTVLIDFRKYQELLHPEEEITPNKTQIQVCADSENEEYRECGNKCVLSCRYATSPEDIAASEQDCDKSECVAGCYCKDGFVLYQDRCILAKECPNQSRKAIEHKTEPENVNSPEKGIFRPGCQGNDCGCQGNDCGCPGNQCITYYTPPRPTSCRPPGCNTAGISIVNHNQAVSGTEHI